MRTESPQSAHDQARPKFTTINRLIIWLIIVACAFASPTTAETDADAAARTDAMRVERLAGLGKAWGAAKWFHPAFASREIDWDGALIKAIPEVTAARSQAEYVVALNTMLALLADPTTTATEISDTTPAVPAAPAELDPIRMQGRALWVDAQRASLVTAASVAAATDPVARAAELSATANAIVLDLRSGHALDEDSEYQRHTFLRSLAPMLIERDLRLATMRSRTYSGFVPQVGGTSGGYYATLATLTPEWLPARRATPAPPILILVDRYSASLDLIAGLQDAGRAHIVQQGAAPSLPRMRLALADDVELLLSTSDLVHGDGRIGFAADQFVAPGAAEAAVQAWIADPKMATMRIARSPAAGAPRTPTDLPYIEMTFPAREYRLLALFRYWNAIEHFYPNTDLIERDWDDVLRDYIPRFDANRTALDYQRTVLELATETQDSHSYTRGADAVAEHIGAFVAPLQLREVEGRSVVTQVFDNRTPVQRGDTVLSIDGVPIATRIKTLAAITPAATPQALSTLVHNGLMRGAKDSLATLELRAPDGNTRRVEIPRSLPRGELFEKTQRRGPTFRRLGGNIAYVDLARLQPFEVERMFDLIALTDATIFDMRGYPNGTAWAIAPRLTTKQSPVNALFSRVQLERFSFGGESLGNSRLSFEQRLPKATGKPYLGKVVMLINAEAISQAEHSCLMFEVATDVTFIGTPTMGANGDVTNLTLPGGLIAHFGGHNVRHADGRALQRVGIQPTIRVEPTIAGIAAGRDEILDAAIAFASKHRATKQ